MKRLVAGLPFAIVITGALFLVMHSLIREPEAPEETLKERPVESVLVEKKPPPPPEETKEQSTKEKAKLTTYPDPVSMPETVRPPPP